MKIADLFAALTIRPNAASLKAADRFLKNADGQVDKFVKRVNAKLGTALNWAGAGIGAGLLIGARDALKFDEALTTLKIATNGAIGSTEEMRQTFLAMSTASGVSKEQIVAAANAYFDLTSDAKGTTAAVATFAKTAKATNASMEDVTAVAAAMREQFGIMPAEFEAAFGTLNDGAKLGSVSLANMGSLMTSMSAKFKQFGGAKGIGGLGTISAMFQTVKKDTGTAAEAETNVSNLLAKIVARKGELSKIGVMVEEGKVGSGKYKDIITILELLKASRAKNFEAFGEAFGHDIQATSALDSLTNLDPATGRQRLDMLQELIDKTKTSNSISTDFAVRQQSAAERATRAWNALKNSFSQVFTPEVISGIASALQTVVDVVGSLVKFVGGAENAVYGMIAAWVAFKSMNLGVMLAGLASQLGAVAAAAGGKGVLGLGAKLGGLAAYGGAAVGALASGYAAGTALDNWLGISDKIVGVGDFRDPIHEADKAKSRAAKAKAAAAAGVVPGATTNITINASSNEPKALAAAVYDEKRKAELRAAAASVGVP